MSTHETMTVGQLRELLNSQYSDSRYDQMPVVIESFRDSIGPQATYGITSAGEGIDWDSGNFFLHSYERSMTHYKEKVNRAQVKKTKQSSIAFVIPLNPVTKKNSNQIIVDRRTGKRKVIPSEAFQQYSQDASFFIRSYQISTPINVEAHYYMKTRKRVDLTNLNEALHDIMVDRQCIIDDNSRIIVSTDGSRVLYDPQNPRTEVKITFLDDYGDPFQKESQSKEKHEKDRVIVDRESFRRKQTAGIARARANGVSLGRPKKKKPDNFELIKRRYLKKEISSRCAAKELGIAQSTFLKWIKD